MKGLEKALAGIKDAGFSHIKVELEAQMNRRSRERPCTGCNRTGRIACTDCSSLGYAVTGTVLNNRIVECASCNGRGAARHADCNGQGIIRHHFDDEEVCAKFIFNEVSQVVYGMTLDERIKARKGKPHVRIPSGGFASAGFIEGITYARFYYDGSVDSELTFTVPVEYVQLAKEVIIAFRKLGETVGSMDVSGAGMHIAVLPKQDKGKYPGSYRMPEKNYDNFKNEVTKLLPALFFCASADHQSRGLSYRHPRISDYEKYSAIYAPNRRCFEYRVFETCYKRPDAFLEYIQVIANTLRFYKDTSLKVKAQGKQFPFPGQGREVSRFVQSIEQVRIINATVKVIKPEGKSLKKMREERGVETTVKALRQKQKIKEARLRSDYVSHKKRMDSLLARELNPDERAKVDRYIIEGYRYDAAVARVRGANPLPNLTMFLQQNLNEHVSASTRLAV